MDIPPIRTRQDDATALKVASTLVDAHPTPGTAESDELDVLSILIERYEAHHFPLKAPNPIETIKFRMEQACLRQAPRPGKIPPPAPPR